jgi:hypothetical protein
MQSHERGMNLIAIGIGMMLAAVILTAILLIALLGIMLLPALGVNVAGLMRALVFVISFSLPIAVTASILSVVGPTLCLAAPREARVTELLLGANACNAIVLVLQVLPRFLTLPTWLAQTWFLFYVSGVLLFTLFLKRLSKYLGAADNFKLAVSTLRLGIFAFAAAAATVICSEVLRTGGSPIPGMSGAMILLGLLLLCTITAAIFGLRYLRLLTRTRRRVLDARTAPFESLPDGVRGDAVVAGAARK